MHDEAEDKLYNIYRAFAQAFTSTARHEHATEAMLAATPNVLVSEERLARWKKRFEQHDRDPHEVLSTPCPRCRQPQYFPEDRRARYCIFCKLYHDGCTRHPVTAAHSGGPRCAQLNLN